MNSYKIRKYYKKLYKRRLQKNKKVRKSLWVAILGLIILCYIFKINSSSSNRSKFQNNVIGGSAYWEYSTLDNDDNKSGEVDEILKNVLKEQMGKPYKYGAEGPESFDCSGLIQFVYSKIDIKLPRVAYDQSLVGEEVSWDNLKFGDIVFFSKDGKSINHDGIYIGEGKIIHAPQTGDVVKESTINKGYYLKNFKKAVRVLNN